MSKKMLAFLAVLACSSAALAQDRNDASDATHLANQAVLQSLPFDDTEDFELVERGLVARPDSLVIRNASGRAIWDMDRFAFVDGAAPAEVNPSLWRQAQLNRQTGLYQVAEDIYQVRGFDISNLSIIVGDTGYIIVDPLLTQEPARAALEFAFEHLPQRPVVAVIYSHSHADHFGGVQGVVSRQDVAAGKVRIIASQGFMDFAVSENILAGNVMRRRATYMFGALLPSDEKGIVDVGLGKAISAGGVTLIEPTDIITETGQEMVIDGVRFVFMNTPYAEAPAELMFYLPGMKAFYAAEEANGTLHNLYTLRGAQVRDALLWSDYLHEAIDLIPKDTELLFGGHHWPRWGYDRIVEYLDKQGDTYRYIHDQTLRLANHGYTMDEISGQLDLPHELASAWYNRGYYGTVSHNSRAVYQKYLGFFDGNPANMHPLPPEEAGKRYVEVAGGADALLEKAQAAYDAADYRWVVELVNHLVFAEPENTAARYLQADALEQLGYQAESGQWRNFYLTAALELRQGVDSGIPIRQLSMDMINGLSIPDLLDFLAIRLNGPAATGQEITLNFDFEDLDETYVVMVRNGVLHHGQGQEVDEADATISLPRGSFLGMVLAGIPPAVLLATNAMSIDGDPAALDQFLALLDDFEFWFNIVTP